MFSCSSFYFLSQPISTSTPISQKINEETKKVEAINSISDDTHDEIVWPLPDSNSRIRPSTPIRKPKNVSPVGHEVKYLKCFYILFSDIFFFVFQKAKFTAIQPREVNVSNWNAVTTFDDSLPPSNSRPAMHQKHPPSTTTTASLHGPATTVSATIPPTGGLSIENLLPQQTTTQVQEPENWTFNSPIQSTETLDPSNDNEEFLMIDSGVYLFECETSNSSFNTTDPESPDQNKVKMEKSITGALSNQVNC